MNAFDTAAVLIGKSKLLKEAGITAVGVYPRTDRTPDAEIAELRAEGIKLFFAYEKGVATEPRYFTDDQAKVDAQRWLDYARQARIPSGENIQLFSAVDYDANPADTDAYEETLHGLVKAGGFLLSGYGSGLLCKHYISLGIWHEGWLSQSSGFPGHEDFKPDAAIVQGLTPSSFHGLSIDPDVIQKPSVLW